jgi:hypothetical protein
MVEAAGIEQGISEKSTTVPNNLPRLDAHGKDAPIHPFQPLVKRNHRSTALPGIY